MAENFTWYPDASHSVELEPKVSSAKFGDGYEQRVAAGINNALDVWSLTFTGTSAQIAPIDAFLKARGAVAAFNWTNPYSETGLYLCRKWGKSREHATKCTLTCQFERIAA